MGKKSYKNILIYDVSYKSLIGAKSLRIMFEKVDGLIRDYDGTKYLILFGLEKYDAIYNGIRLKNGLKMVLHMFSFTILEKSKKI